LLAAAIGLLVVTNLIQLWIIWLAASVARLSCPSTGCAAQLVKDLVGEADFA